MNASERKNWRVVEIDCSSIRGFDCILITEGLTYQSACNIARAYSAWGYTTCVEEVL